MSNIDTSTIDPTKPTQGIATTASVRENFTGIIDNLEVAKAEIVVAETHITSDGSDHTFVDQDVTTTSSPTFVSPAVDSVQLDTTATVEVAQGELAWNADEETFDFGMNGATWQGGLETFYHVRNNTGVTIPNGTLVMSTGTLGASGRILIAPFDGTDPANAKYILGFVTYDILTDTDGKVTNFGKVRGLDTSAYLDGDILWASSTVAGEVIATEPADNLIGMPVAIVVYSHATAGVLNVRITPIDEHKHALRVHTHDDLYLDRSAWNGTFKESFNAVVTSDGTTITMALEKKGGGDLTMQLSDGLSTLDCTPADTITLTPGTDTSPQANYVYVLQSTKALTASTVGWPAAEHIKISFFFIKSALFVQTHGATINQNWNDELSSTDEMGHITHIGQWIRAQGANWYSGCDGGGTNGYITPGATGGTIQVNAGVIMQMHKHNYAAKDTATGDNAQCPNYPGEAYKTVTDLDDMVVDSQGGSLSNRYYNIVIGGVANKGGEYSPLMISLPAGSYNSSANAVNDVDHFDDLSMPREFNKESSTGFLIARITLFRAVSGLTTVINTQDLRGLTGATASASLGGEVLTDFADSQFSVYNNTDSTKILNVDTANITTGNTRTVTMADANIDLGDMPVSATQQTALNLKANIESPTFTGTVSGVTAAMVGLGSVEDGAEINNISDINATDLTDGGLTSLHTHDIPGGFVWTVQATDVTAADLDGIAVDTTALARTVTAPLSPTVGVQFSISDFAGLFGTNNCTVARNGELIMGLAEDFVCDYDNFGATFVFVGGTVGWKIVAITPDNLSLSSIAVDTFVDATDYTSGTTTQLTLTVEPINEQSVFVTFDGVSQHRSTYSVAGSVVTFDTAIPLGTDEVEITAFNNVVQIVPEADSVTESMLDAGLSTKAGYVDQDVGAGSAPSFNGIAFPATQVPSADANTLDDYEEGTFTFDLEFGGASTGITYGLNEGFYTKVGDMVLVYGYFLLSSKGTATGIAKIEGLPFISRNYSAISLAMNLVSFADFPQGDTRTGESAILLRELTNAGVRTELTDTNFANTTTLVISVTYKIA